jgi:hypothetical protein
MNEDPGTFPSLFYAGRINWTAMITDNIVQAKIFRLLIAKTTVE